MTTQTDLFDQPAAHGPGERQTDLEALIAERKPARTEPETEREAQHLAGFDMRVSRAAAHMASGRPITRSLDNCFENFDGDAVAHALYRRAAKNPEGKLARNIGKYLCGHANADARRKGPHMSLEYVRRMSLEQFRNR